MATFWAILQVLPKVIALFQFIAGMARDAEQRGLGRKEAIAEALTIAHEQLALANKAEQEAVADHVAHPNDNGGFDGMFQRKD